MCSSLGAEARSYAKMKARRPARAEYAAIDEPALPVLTTEVAVNPNWSAAPTAVADVRSLTVPVGLAPSNLTSSRRTPSAAPGADTRSTACRPRPARRDGQDPRWAG